MEFRELLAAFAAKYGVEGLDGAYALVRPFPLALVDVESLAAGLESLVNQTENWRTALAGLREAEVEQPAARKVDDSHHDMLSSGFVHV